MAGPALPTPKAVLCRLVKAFGAEKVGRSWGLVALKKQLS